MKTNKKITIKINDKQLKPRNPLVSLIMFRKAGKMSKSVKSLRIKEKCALKKGEYN